MSADSDFDRVDELLIRIERLVRVVRYKSDGVDDWTRDVIRRETDQTIRVLARVLAERARESIEAFDEGQSDAEH
jgi:hypothetical protein